MRTIHTKEAASLLRKALKNHFPGTKFSVRFERYSMGSQINVRWTNGPSQRAVEAFAAPFSGTRYDGMTESTYYVNSYLLPSGVAVAVKDGEPVPDGAEQVQFYGSRPDCSREITEDYIATCEKVWPKLPVVQRCALLKHHAFPRYGELTDGQRLARFFDAQHFGF